MFYFWVVLASSVVQRDIRLQRCFRFGCHIFRASVFGFVCVPVQFRNRFKAAASRTECGVFKSSLSHCEIY